MTRLVTQVTSLVLDMVVLDRQEDRLFDEVQVFPEEEEVHDLNHPETTKDHRHYQEQTAENLAAVGYLGSHPPLRSD